MDALAGLIMSSTGGSASTMTSMGEDGSLTSPSSAVAVTMFEPCTSVRLAENVPSASTRDDPSS